MADTHVATVVARSRAWWLVAASLIAAFLARAPLYLSVFPPFEGWDEPQHLAYIVHLDETGTVPVMNESVVPLSLRPLFVGIPQAPPGGQLRDWGALSYDEYWRTGPPADASREATFSFRLYQAQHPPLAYALGVPIWRWLKTPRPLDAIFALRLVNVLIAAAGLVLFAAALERLVPTFGPRVVVLALVCLHPLFFQNVARVANDALAVSTGLAGISVLALANDRTLLTRGLLAAVCIATSVWTKQTSFTLIPALVVGLPLIGWRHNVLPARIVRVTCAAVGAFFLLVAPLWVWNYQHYGSIVTTQDTLELAARGDVVAALMRSFSKIAWRPVVANLFVPGQPWVGGWSFLPIHETLAALHAWIWGIVVTAAGAGAVTALRRAPRIDGGLAVCAAVVVFTTLGMMYYTVLSHAVFGAPLANPWYFMTALPFLFVLLVRGLETISTRLAMTAGAALAALYVAIELHGTWILMPRAYASTTDVALQWARLTAIHPAILRGGFRWLFLAAHVGALCVVAGALLYTRRRRGTSSVFEERT
ncbi:MAG TPA: hypothetical protein VKB50_26920 [Vicinamibacterales bacterium]|nr:hypothetical protein [Vicinamibacterales bacterium]